MTTEQFPNEGGTYEMGKDGVRRRVDLPTQPHPEGDGPREADGKAIVDDSVERHEPKQD